MEDISALKALLSTPKHIVVTVHHRPDGDALGSGLGLAALLRKQQHQVQVIAPSAYPDFLGWLPGAPDVIVFEKKNQQKASDFLKKADVIFCVDFPTLCRLNGMEAMVRETTATKVVIDHHPNEGEFAALAFRDTTSAATAELLYEIFEGLGVQDLIDKDIAECLYVGIMTDTGSFKHATTTAKTHRIAARLIDHGADITKATHWVCRNNSLNKLAFLGFALSHRFVVLKEYNTAYFFITAEDYKNYALETGDTEGLVDYALSVRNIAFAATIKEKKDCISLSLRSSGEVPVNLWAKEHFGGGGHKNAAGGISQLTLAETVAKFEDLVKINKKTLTN